MYGFWELALKHFSFSASIRLQAYEYNVSTNVNVVVDYTHLFYLSMACRRLPLEKDDMYDSHGYVEIRNKRKRPDLAIRRGTLGRYAKDGVYVVHESYDLTTNFRAAACNRAAAPQLTSNSPP